MIFFQGLNILKYFTIKPGLVCLLLSLLGLICADVQSDLYETYAGLPEFLVRSLVQSTGVKQHPKHQVQFIFQFFSYL